MDTHKQILRNLVDKKFPKNIDSENFPEINIFRELYERGLVAAIDARNFNGERFLETRITMEGRQFLDDSEKSIQKNSHAFNIGSISGGVIQLGNGNSAGINISLHEIVEQISKSGDAEAKSKLKEFLNNATVATLIGSGIQGLLSCL